MAGRNWLIGVMLLVIVVIGGTRALTSTPPATVGDAREVLGAILAEHCVGSDESGLNPSVTHEWCSMAVREITLRGAGDKRVSFPVLVAVEASQRQAGYQSIDAELVNETATLFLFPRPIYGAFHMCNVEAPLWIVWYVEDGRPLDAQLMLPGEKLPAAQCEDVYAPRRPGLYRYALEIGQELAREHGLGFEELATMRLTLAPWMGQGR